VLPMPRGVARPLTLAVSAANGDAELAAELRYDTADPFAVTLTIGVDCPKPVVWIFARDLLAEGIGVPVGEGDITVEPATDVAGEQVRITLATDCLATLLAPRDAVTEFLGESYARVPTGTESDQIDLDAEIATLLA
jgi:hypothetical protein